MKAIVVDLDRTLLRSDKSLLDAIDKRFPDTVVCGILDRIALGNIVFSDPQALADLIAKKREKPFKLTYADGQDMYIVVGEGPQTGGGYSIVVKELYLADNSIVIKTELMGPEKTEAAGTDLSYPVLIVKTAYMEEPVVFK